MRRILLLFFLLPVLCFGKINKLSQIKDIEGTVKEISFLNGEKKIKEYTIEYIENDYLRKVILFPKINKGEIYLYEKGKSQIYIPLFNEITEERNNEEINSFLGIINELKEKDRKDKNFVQNYYVNKIR